MCLCLLAITHPPQLAELCKTKGWDWATLKNDLRSGSSNPKQRNTQHTAGQQQSKVVLNPPPLPCAETGGPSHTCDSQGSGDTWPSPQQQKCGQQTALRGRLWNLQPSAPSELHSCSDRAGTLAPILLLACAAVSSGLQQQASASDATTNKLQYTSAEHSLPGAHSMDLLGLTALERLLVCEAMLSPLWRLGATDSSLMEQQCRMQSHSASDAARLWVAVQTSLSVYQVARRVYHNALHGHALDLRHSCTSVYDIPAVLYTLSWSTGEMEVRVYLYSHASTP